MRTSSGRVLLLPQAQSSLRNILEAIFRNINPLIMKSEPYNMPPSEQKVLIDNLSNIEFVSALLTGLTEDPLTLHRGGMHVKHMVRFPNAKPVVIDAAVRAAAPIGISNDVMNLMGSETTKLPYGDSVAFDSDGPCPMKPVTHGRELFVRQFSRSSTDMNPELMFTKLNIIDKFDQAVAVVDPKPHLRTGNIVVQPITPSLTDAYFPGTIGDTDPKLPSSRANVVLPQASNTACRFLQLTPSINQPARINEGFVLEDAVTNKWRVAGEWENPVWVWIIINYPDSGLQIHTPDGTFYREVRLGGPSSSGATASLKWLPFDPPASTLSQPTTQLDFLIKKLIDRTYLTAFFDVLNESISELQVSAPSTYSQYISKSINRKYKIPRTCFIKTQWLSISS